MLLLNQGRTAARSFLFTVVVLWLSLSAFPQATQGKGQATATTSRVVAITSDPPGAMIWKKEGTTLTCTDTFTPGTVDLKFHSEGDLKKVLLRKFGYVGKNLDVKVGDEKISAALGVPFAYSFLTTKDDPPDLKKLDNGLKEEFVKTVLADKDAFRCMPFELNFVLVQKDKQADAFEIALAVNVDRSFGGSGFRIASHSNNPQERQVGMARAALEGGVAEILARSRPVAAKFPEVKSILVLCIYSTTQADLATNYSFYSITARTGPSTLTTFEGWLENTVVKDNPAVGTIMFTMPVAQIPDTMDKNEITDTVLAVGKIVVKKHSSE